MDDGSAGENSQQESSAGVGKNVNNDGTAKVEVKTEDCDVKIKLEPMEVDDAAGAGSGANSTYTTSGEAAKAVGTGDSKDGVKPMTDGNSAAGSDVKVKSETKPVAPEPLMPNAGDKKKKCGKYNIK